MENKGQSAILVGYPKDHAGNVYRFFTLNKSSIVLLQDIQWMKKTWAQYGKEDESDCNSEEEEVPGLIEQTRRRNGSGAKGEDPTKYAKEMRPLFPEMKSPRHHPHTVCERSSSERPVLSHHSFLHQLNPAPLRSLGCFSEEDTLGSLQFDQVIRRYRNLS